MVGTSLMLINTLNNRVSESNGEHRLIKLAEFHSANAFEQDVFFQ